MPFNEHCYDFGAFLSKKNVVSYIFGKISFIFFGIGMFRYCFRKYSLKNKRLGRNSNSEKTSKTMGVL